MSSASFSPVLDQGQRNRALLDATPCMADKITAKVLPFSIDIDATDALSDAQIQALGALEIQASRTAIEAVAEVTRLGEVDHLGGGLDLISALTLTLSICDQEAKEYTIEHAHTSIGYYSSLSARGFLDADHVAKSFRQSLDIAGHVSWVAGGTQLNGGRLGVMIPAAVGQALGKKARHGEKAWVICHCGDAGWVSGQAMNGFNAADLHKAPVTFVMHRNGIQLSGSTRSILDKDPRPIIAALGVEIIEVSSLHDLPALFAAYKKARELAKQGRPSMIYPVGEQDTLQGFAEKRGIVEQTKAFTEKNGVAMDAVVHVPGALMSHRDVRCMLECLFLVNQLPGGAGHHDGSLKGRDKDEVLANPMMQWTAEQKAALDALRAAPPVEVITQARPAVGSPNLILSEDVVNAVSLPMPGTSVSPRAGVQVGYEAIAKSFPDDMFVIDCDLAPSTKVDKARKALAADHQFELSIEEQIAAIMANGLAVSTHAPQLVVFGTFSAFFEGIAREGFEMWRYQRNLNGINEGLNVTLHLSHVGACTGRDHFSGWSLDWINLAIGYLPYLHRFYAPADARAAFIAIRDLAACYGGHIIAIPRDNLPILTKQDSDEPLFNAGDAFEALTLFRSTPGAKKAILALGAPAFLAEDVVASLAAKGTTVDAYVVNGLPLAEGALDDLAAKYPGGLVSIEDGLIADEASGLRGFAAMVAGATRAHGLPVAHVGITDPRVAPAEGHMQVWEHFGITAEALERALLSL